MEKEHNKLPVAVIGAGPIGLSAAVHLLKWGYEPILIEAGDQAGANLAQWGHLRMFSPWHYNMDAAAIALLRQLDWTEPAANAFPTGKELLDHYVAPLASHPEIAPHLHLNTQVRQVSRLNHDVLRTKGRNNTPFVLRVHGPDGEQDITAQAVIDASGTYQTPNWLGTHGIPALGENAAANDIAYGVPDILGSERERYTGKTVLVVGGGHSAFNALQDLTRLGEHHKGMRVLWGVRSASVANIVRSPESDELQERRRLEVRIQELIDQGRLEPFTGLEIETIHRVNDKIVVQSGSRQLPPVDRIIAATGFRPNLGLLAELRTSLDSATQSPSLLAPLIDPNIHSCGSVPEHGVEQLTHPEPGLYIVGIKSYGRAPTFLLRTGYRQVASVVSALAGIVSPGTAEPSTPTTSCRG